jgi:hypothetical protein
MGIISRIAMCERKSVSLTIAREVSISELSAAARLSMQELLARLRFYATLFSIWCVTFLTAYMAASAAHSKPSLLTPSSG